MFQPRSTTHKQNINKVIDELIETLGEHKPESDEYAAIVKRISELKDVNNKDGISKETAATIAANFAGLLLILQHERLHVIASKAFALVGKLR